MLIWWSFQVEVMAAAVIVMPRSFSWGIQSMVVVPSSTPPIRWMTPVRNNTRSVTVVLPASMWAMNPMFLIFSMGPGVSMMRST